MPVETLLKRVLSSTRISRSRSSTKTNSLTLPVLLSTGLPDHFSGAWGHIRVRLGRLRKVQSAEKSRLPKKEKDARTETFAVSEKLPDIPSKHRTARLDMWKIS